MSTQSPSHTPTQIDAEIEIFLENFQEELKQMTEEEFEHKKQQLSLDILKKIKKVTYSFFFAPCFFSPT